MTKICAATRKDMICHRYRDGDILLLGSSSDEQLPKEESNGDHDWVLLMGNYVLFIGKLSFTEKSRLGGMKAYTYLI